MLAARRPGAGPRPESDGKLRVAAIATRLPFAGAVLAARLSQDPTRTVLLHAAGPAYAQDAFPA